MIDMETVDQEITDRHTALIDANGRLFTQSRRKAQKMIALAERYEMMGEGCRQIAGLHLLAAAQLTESLASLLGGEFDLETVLEGFGLENTDTDDVVDDDDE